MIFKYPKYIGESLFALHQPEQSSRLPLHKGNWKGRMTAASFFVALVGIDQASLNRGLASRKR